MQKRWYLRCSKWGFLLIAPQSGTCHQLENPFEKFVGRTWKTFVLVNRHKYSPRLTSIVDMLFINISRRRIHYHAPDGVETAVKPGTLYAACRHNVNLVTRFKGWCARCQRFHRDFYCFQSWEFFCKNIALHDALNASSWYRGNAVSQCYIFYWDLLLNLLEV
jgi:hypothetical protein